MLSRFDPLAEQQLAAAFMAGGRLPLTISGCSLQHRLLSRLAWSAHAARLQP